MTDRVSPATQRALDAQREAGHASKAFASFDLGDRIGADARIVASAQPSDIEIADLLRDEAEARVWTHRVTGLR